MKKSTIISPDKGPTKS